MLQGGREIVGFVLAAAESVADDDALEASIEFAWTFVKSLPAK
jgi:hypothetical protein